MNPFDYVRPSTVAEAIAIAADRRRVAKLGRGAREQRLRHGRIGPGEALVVCELGIADHRADARAAVVEPIDAVPAAPPAAICASQGQIRSAGSCG